MDFINFIIDYALPFLVVLTVLIFVHELGHFLVARRNGVRVEVFSIGFGNELWGFNDKHGTRWRFSAVPLGGYVKMFGEGDVITGVDDTEDRPMTEEEKKVSFHHKRLRQRTAIVAAGPLANFLFAIVLFWAINSILGVPQVLSTVGEIIDDTAAEEAGFVAGDKILAVNGDEITLFSELSAIVAVNANVELDFEILRNDQVIHLKATPRPWNLNEEGEAEDDDGEEDDDNGHEVSDTEDGPAPRGLLGVRPDVVDLPSERKGVGEGLVLAVEQTYGWIATILGGIGEMFAGDRSAKELGGILMIAEVSGEAAQSGLLPVLHFMAILSINLGLINLFPVPVLDGGHLAFYAAEALRGKPLSARVQEYGFRLGLVLVLLLMVFATWNDFERLFDKFS